MRCAVLCITANFSLSISAREYGSGSGFGFLAISVGGEHESVNSDLSNAR
jgi:hypothetical protein